MKYFESYFYDGSILSFKFRFCFIVLFLSTYCFPVLIFCFYLYLNLCLAREFTYCHIRNVTGGRVRGVRADLGSLVLVSCDCA